MLSQALSRSAALWLEAGRPAAAVEALEALQGLSAKLKPAERQELGSRLGRARAAAAGRSQPDHYRLLGLKQGASADDVSRQTSSQAPFSATRILFKIP